MSKKGKGKRKANDDDDYVDDSPVMIVPPPPPPASQNPLGKPMSNPFASSNLSTSFSNPFASLPQNALLAKTPVSITKPIVPVIPSGFQSACEWVLFPILLI
jgi:hypothetical protein